MASVRGLLARFGIRRPPVEFTERADTWDGLVRYHATRHQRASHGDPLAPRTRITRADMDRSLGRVDWPPVTSASPPDEGFHGE